MTWAAGCCEIGVICGECLWPRRDLSSRVAAMEWRRTPSIDEFLTAQLADESMGVVTTGQRILDAEFPPDLQASVALRAVGANERTFTAIAEKSGPGPFPSPGLCGSWPRNVSLRSTTRHRFGWAVKLSRYRVADSYLRFWLRFVEAGISDIQRGRPDLAVARVTRDWPDYGGGPGS